jgi:predicted TIM-barrel fold metal-dependent hydrolase
MPPIVDVQTYVMPAMELVYERGTPQFRGQWPVLEGLLGIAAPQEGIGDWKDPYLYLPATGEPVSGAWPQVVVPAGVTLPSTPIGDLEPGVLHDNPRGRLAAMDRAGVDCQLISPGPSIDACITLPSNLAAGVLGAYNRYVTTYCEPAPERLKAVIQVHGAEPHWSAREIRELAGDPSVAGVSICLPVKLAPDEENYRPIWEAVEETGLPVVQRPGFAAAVWTPRRLLAYLGRTGVLARHPGVRLCFVGFGADWLPDALRDGADISRIFVAIDGREAAGDLRPVLDGIGAECLLWHSGFPYCEGRYGTSAALGELSDSTRHAALEDNASRCLTLV